MAYHPERFFENALQIDEGARKLAGEIYPAFLPHKPHEIFEGPSRVYIPQTFNGIYRHRHQLRKGKVIMPRDHLLQQKYLDRLARLRDEEAFSPDGQNSFTRHIKRRIEEGGGVAIEPNWYPYNVPQKDCKQYSVWYDEETSIYTRAFKLAYDAYVDGLDKDDLVIWINIPRNRSVPSIGHAQVIIRDYPDKFWSVFPMLPIKELNPDIYPLQSSI